MRVKGRWRWLIVPHRKLAAPRKGSCPDHVSEQSPKGRLISARLRQHTQSIIGGVIRGLVGHFRCEIRIKPEVTFVVPEPESSTTHFIPLRSPILL